MAVAGFVLLVVAFAATTVSVCAFCAGFFASRRKASAALPARAARMFLVGRAGVAVTAAALLVCCFILVFAFMTGDVSILYVLQERSHSTGSLAWLYKLSGLWAGRAGSLLFGAFLISVFNVAVLVRTARASERLDNAALMVVQVVLAAFIGVLVFSEANMPFAPTPARYFVAGGELSSSAALLGMNTLLEHWAMAIHPPTLFVGYAGLTVPFAYAIAALVVGDASKAWVERSTRFVLFSWLFLGVGIGLGAVWAYVVLGWGGYWGWDPVENASLLSWLVGVALIHTLTVYRQRGAFKRWAVMCACLAFAFVIVGTFISRSGIVQSVHAFEGDPVSLALFGALIVLSVAAGLAGLALRWKQFGPDTEGADDVENMFSKDAAYYFNNVIMIVFTLLLTYMTVAQALPSWLPFGGDSLGTTAYDAIARPLGIVYLLILAVCPLLAWGKTDMKRFAQLARIPVACALVLFALFMWYFFTNLLPAYDAMLMLGGSNSQELLEAGPPVYYNALAVIGLLVASLLFFNALFMFARGVNNYAKSHKTNALAAAVGLFKGHASTYGGSIAHLSLSIILVGLIGSSMYVTEKTAYMGYDEEANTATEDFTIQDYTLKFADQSVTEIDDGKNVLYEVVFDVYQGDRYLGQARPQVQLNAMTQQQKLNASVISMPDEDLFVVYRGVNSHGALSLDVRVNPLVNLVWFGFALLMVGAFLAIAGRRRPEKAAAKVVEADDTAEKPALMG